MVESSEQKDQGIKVARTAGEIGLGYALGGALALLLVPVLGFWLLREQIGDTAGVSLGLGVLGILGVFALVAALGALILIVGALGISDPRYSLGLPQGSVRAIIALTIAITFLVLAVFIPQIITDVDTTVSENLSEGMVAALPQDRIVSIVPVPGSGRFNVEMIMPRDDSARDLNKQIITVISTLLVAVVAFYFGSRTVAQARDVVSGTGPSTTGTAEPDPREPDPEEEAKKRAAEENGKEKEAKAAANAAEKPKSDAG